jgi:hypothetical protein
MITALVEWLLLAKCHLLLHTHGSSFAQEVTSHFPFLAHFFPSLKASLVHRVPLVSLWSGVATFSLDTRLPYCGHLQYCKRGTKVGKEVVYEEGTFDRRKVVGRMLSLQPCSLLLSEWGVLQLYCLESGEGESEEGERGGLN